MTGKGYGGGKAAGPVADSHAELARSADEIEHSSAAQEDSAERRTHLAADRTLFAEERTYAAWMRSGLTAMAAGIGSKALLENLIPTWLTLATSLVLVLFAMFCFIAAVWRQFDVAVAPPVTDVRRLPRSVLIAFSAFLVAVSGAVLAGLWAR